MKLPPEPPIEENRVLLLGTLEVGIALAGDSQGRIVVHHPDAADPSWEPVGIASRSILMMYARNPDCPEAVKVLLRDMLAGACALVAVP